MNAVTLDIIFGEAFFMSKRQQSNTTKREGRGFILNVGDWPKKLGFNKTII